MNCMNIPKNTLTGYISLSNGGWFTMIEAYITQFETLKRFKFN